jgi:capsular exopolysaccharide synthesis family protein
MDGFRRTIGMGRRRWRIFGAVFLAIFLAVALYTFTRTRLYTATSGMVVNSRELNLAEKDKDILPVLPTNEGAADTEVEILRSTAVAANTVRALDLTHNPLFAKGLESLPDQVKLAAVTAIVKSNLKIARPGEANVVAIAYTSPDPAIAKAIADQVGREYLNVKEESRRSAVENVDKGLGTELEDLRGRLEQAEADVARYKAANNLLSSDGVTLTETELSLYKQQDAAARAVLAGESARLRTARAQLARGSSGDDVGPALQSPVIQQLRTQRSLISTKIADLEARYRPDHPDLIKARDQLADIDRDIQAEIRRVVSNLEANARIAADQAANARATADATSGTLAVNNAAGVKLAELQRKADGLKDTYQTLLTRRNSIRSQALVADEDARLFSPALLPLNPSSPNRPLMLAIGLALAAMAAGVTVWLLETFNRGLTGSRDVELRLGLHNLAHVPDVASIARADERHITAVDFCVERPLSLYAEALRSIRLALIGAHAAGVPVLAGVTSSRPGEGKTTLAISLARVAAQSGSRTLLIDADLRRPSVAHTLGIKPVAGLVEVLRGDVPVESALVRDAATGLMILPVRAPYAGSELLDAAHIDRLVDTLRDRFDLVIFDVAPALAVADARQLLRQLDDIILAVQWRSTPRQTAMATLRHLRALGMQPLGVVLTQVDMVALSKSGEAEADYSVESYGAYRLA